MEPAPKQIPAPVSTRCSTIPAAAHGVAFGSALGGLTLATSRSTAAVCWPVTGIEPAALTLTAHNRRGKTIQPVVGGPTAR